MSQEKPIKKLIDAWTTRQDFADDVGANVATVHKWAASGRVPADRQKSVVEAAQARGLSHVTPEWMLLQHARREGGAA